MSIYMEHAQLKVLSDEQLADLAKILKDEQQRRKDCKHKEMKSYFTRKVQELQEFAVKAREQGYGVELEITDEERGTKTICLDEDIIIVPHVYCIYQSKG